MEESGKYGMIGTSAKMLELYKNIELVALNNTKVLIRGERGTGKELVANAIHYNSPRAKQPFIKVNCAAIPPTLLESEFFGHEKGAFTDAHRQKRGRFEEANHGTLFLDEIADMSIEVQPKLLRAIEYGDFQRVGGNRVIKTDVRLVTATSKYMEWLINEKKFRSDLHDRINGFMIDVPPLRERSEDIPVLVHYFIKKYEKKEIRCKGINPKALKLLLEYDWPGNVRQLDSTIEGLATLAQGEEISGDLVRDYLMRNTSPSPSAPPRTQSRVQEPPQVPAFRIPQEPARSYSITDFERIDKGVEERVKNLLSELKDLESYIIERDKITARLKSLRDKMRNGNKNPPINAVPPKKSLPKDLPKDYPVGETMLLFHLSKKTRISYNTLSAPLNKKSGLLKFERRDGYVETTVPHYIEYFTETGNSKAKSKLERYLQRNPEMRNAAIRKDIITGSVSAGSPAKVRAYSRDNISSGLRPRDLSDRTDSTIHTNTIMSALRRGAGKLEKGQKPRLSCYLEDGYVVTTVNDLADYFENHTGFLEAAETLRKYARKNPKEVEVRCFRRKYLK